MEEDTHLSFAIKYADGDILPEEVYYPDKQNRIVISDLGKVIIPYVKESAANGFLVNGYYTPLYISFYINEDPYNTTVMLCDNSSSLDASAFTSRFFLSTFCGRVKDTSMQRREYLSVYSKSNEACSVAVDYLDYQYAYSSEVITVPASSPVPVQRFDVSPARFARKGKRIISFVVKCGDRQQRYTVNPQCPNETNFVYLNCFGVEETLSAPGENIAKIKAIRDQLLISNKLKSQIKESFAEHTVNTGPVSSQEAGAWEDLCVSDKVCTYDHFGNLNELVITDQDLEKSSDRTQLIFYKITYRLSVDKQNLSIPNPNNLFTNTFDETFE